MSRRGLLALAGLIAVVATGCDGLRYRSTTNAPGKITLAAPPRENGSPSLYVPAEDPGEHELYVGPGVVAGPGVGRVEVGEDDVAVEVGLYLRLAYAKKAKSHRRDDIPWPTTGWVLNLGWAPLQYAEHADIGPVHAELERAWFIGTIGLGPAIYPDDGNAGVQATAAWKPYGVRLRYMAETGFEVFAAIQVELPTAITWSR